MSGVKERTLGDRLREEYRIYIAALIIVIVAELIGTHRFKIGPGMMVIFPMFYGLILGALLCPQVLGFFKMEEVKAASPLVLVAISPFMAKLGVLAGADLPKLVSVGPALILQELGNLGTIVFALPVALLLGLKREAVGATFSVCRESGLGVISHVYGPDSAEMRGTLSIYVIGYIIGPIYMGLLASLIASTNLFHPYALGMASGVGSGSMMAAASGTLAHVYPDLADDILMLAGASDTLTGINGVYVSLFIALPLVNKLYHWLEPILSPKKLKAGEEK
ncbi:DUF3100 domain-containing protein [Thermanaeromonas sp. C210]|uniref:DUF3100 domain-containing protein n=1 Tax=Thermanaeromonas sp. C210 TaxID=2731925 RepID=UPI00155C59B3|nr:DUF3100 domain-containing protein [Thermanaeromonas sp. C210]GFN24250.1 membrane protein [Thermanaeromonas sp. C210]